MRLRELLNTMREEQVINLIVTGEGFEATNKVFFFKSHYMQYLDFTVMAVGADADILWAYVRRDAV